ncbi:MAG TPA: ROK family protein [Acidimicrobiia bacterium]|nr:ROK family protein [Acidimicrobiia bacterium]
MTARVGVDLGGTKIEAVALDASGHELARRRVPTPAGDYGAILGAIADLVGAVEQAAGDTAEAIGIGTPGAPSPSTGLMKNSNSTVLNGRPLEEDLESSLGRPTVMRNDADCFALSEAVDGAGVGAEVVFGVILGTGVGGGVVVGGEVRQGPNRVGGEWGHNPLPWAAADELPGPDCYCGKRGCIEQWVSGVSFAADHRRRHGGDSDSIGIVGAARSGEPAAARSLDRYVDRLARSLATAINILDPDVIVLGGGMSNVDELYERVPVLWPKYVFGGESATRLLRNVHGDSSGVRGAAMLVPA